ncbi:hypothetical protein [Paenibacillus sp. IHB B 3415]|uniref:hypothetical protein n=1 Tax=Paenibacillus sp. IHB B 3415 TaxID=867080 RepID=UPI00128BF22E|nr:hypothetical protein [Paenibacillus sp. IHB B 3415]
MVHKQIEMIFPAKERKKKRYRERMLESYCQDPRICSCCKHRMLLVVIWHAEYGRIYYYDEETVSECWRVIVKTRGFVPAASTGCCLWSFGMQNMGGFIIMTKSGNTQTKRNGG